MLLDLFLVRVFYCNFFVCLMRWTKLAIHVSFLLHVKYNIVLYRIVTLSQVFCCLYNKPCILFYEWYQTTTESLTVNDGDDKLKQWSMALTLTTSCVSGIVWPG